MTRARDVLSTKRRELPMVKVDKRYVFHGPDRDVALVGDLGQSPEATWFFSHRAKHPCLGL
jgi:predicted dithiol-disulfide oxidoreductase (DUF899 family)